MMLAQLAIVLAIALLMGLVARRLGMPAMVGELIGGVLLGPSLLGWMFPAAHDALFPDGGAPNSLVSGVGQFGVLLLVGLAASELDMGVLRRRSRVVASVGVWSFTIPLALGVGVGFAVPQRFHGTEATTAAFVLLLGTAMSISALPVIAKILTDTGLLRREVGQVVLSAGTLSDIAAWVLLAVVSAMTTVGLRGWQLPLTVTYVVAAIAATFLLRPLVRRLFDRLETSAHGLYVSALAVIVIVAGATLTDALHLESALGAFLAGVLVGRRGGSVLNPLQTVTTVVLAPVFLVTAGMHLDVTELGDRGTLLLAVIVVIVAVVGKLGGGYVGARLVGVSRWESAALGAGLNARGVVEIILATTGLELGVFGEEVYAVIVLMALVTSAMAGPMLLYATSRFESAAVPEIPVAEIPLAANVPDLQTTTIDTERGP
ncbi:cation:proton antiporter [Gordonia sp. CPCC 206044]|uniref:cation:proton antiporter n=1 Tax=Gordonia sp. CPCC 206044 TaxID=3140793 RepID=UPI003AF37EF8